MGPHKGDWLLDLTGPPSLRLGYQLSDRAGLRAGFGGIGLSSSEGSFFELDTSLRISLGRSARLRPYVSGALSYSHRGDPAGGAESVPAFDPGKHSWRFGPGLGVHLGLGGRFAAFWEVRLMHSPTREHESRRWGLRLDDRNQVEFRVGLTLGFR